MSGGSDTDSLRMRTQRFENPLTDAKNAGPTERLGFSPNLDVPPSALNDSSDVMDIDVEGVESRSEQFVTPSKLQQMNQEEKLEHRAKRFKSGPQLS